MKKFIIVLVIIIIGVAAYFVFRDKPTDITKTPDTTTNPTPGDDQPGTIPPQIENKDVSLIGVSTEGRDINAYHFGEGGTEILFVGGIHGGYEWNTALVSYQLMDYLKKNPEIIPDNLKVTVIPVLNPDGLNKVVGTTTGNFTKANVSTSQETVVAGRFNGRNVDLNRNFDCDWKANGTWQNKTVSGGSAAFSEPESLALKNYVESHGAPKAVVVWYSAAGGVYASNCHNGVLSGTETLMNTFAKASGYPAHQNFDFYKITGDMVNWLAKKNIPAISVLLTNHTDTEWTKNKAGIDAVLKSYAE